MNSEAPRLSNTNERLNQKLFERASTLPNESTSANNLNETKIEKPKKEEVNTSQSINTDTAEGLLLAERIKDLIKSKMPQKFDFFQKV